MFLFTRMHQRMTIQMTNLCKPIDESKIEKSKKKIILRHYLSKLGETNVTCVRLRTGVNENMTTKRLLKCKLLLTVRTTVRFFTGMGASVRFMQGHRTRLFTAECTHKTLFRRIGRFLFRILFEITLFRW